jgi:hypothetical protein
MKFIKFYSVAFFKMKILCKFRSFLNFLFLEAAAAAPRRDGNEKYTAATATATAPPWTSLLRNTYRVDTGCKTVTCAVLYFAFINKKKTT